MSDFETLVEVIYLTLNSNLPKSIKAKLFCAELTAYKDFMRNRKKYVERREN